MDKFEAANWGGAGSCPTLNRFAPGGNGTERRVGGLEKPDLSATQASSPPLPNEEIHTPWQLESDT